MKNFCEGWWLSSWWENFQSGIQQSSPAAISKPLKCRHFVLMDILLRNGLHSHQQLFIITLEIQTHSVSGQAFSPSIPRLYKVHLIMQMLGCLLHKIVQHSWLESSGTCLVALNSKYVLPCLLEIWKLLKYKQMSLYSRHAAVVPGGPIVFTWISHCFLLEWTKVLRHSAFCKQLGSSLPDTTRRQAPKQFHSIQNQLKLSTDCGQARSKHIFCLSCSPALEYEQCNHEGGESLVQTFSHMSNVKGREGLNVHGDIRRLRTARRGNRQLTTCTYVASDRQVLCTQVYNVHAMESLWTKA